MAAKRHFLVTVQGLCSKRQLTPRPGGRRGTKYPVVPTPGIFPGKLKLVGVAEILFARCRPAAVSAHMLRIFYQAFVVFQV